MSCHKILSPFEIEEAKELRKLGFTKRQLAERYEVGETTIWENIFNTKKRERKPQVKKFIPRFRKIPSVICLMQELRQDGYTSKEIADYFNIPLKEVNFIFSKFV